MRKLWSYNRSMLLHEFIMANETMFYDLYGEIDDKQKKELCIERMKQLYADSIEQDVYKIEEEDGQ